MSVELANRKAESNASPSPNNENDSPIKDDFFKQSKCEAIDYEWKNLTITATKVEKRKVDGKKVKFVEEKTILNGISGSVKHGNFTAIMGPSGCGKTTLLNFLSARIDANLKIRGEIFINSKKEKDIESISNLVAYVQQDDILMATITPREIFNFTANLRLNLSAKERRERVEALIGDLGLKRCAETKVGNALIRGLSGGERKRTSIGVELITNPSLIFLDEPTTGLDSTTALKILELLVKLAKSGRNVVSTIHQPSSEIFNIFDNLMLMVRGHIIYEGKARDAVNYFAGIGYACPKLTNPADYFMKIMSETGMIVDEIQQKKDDDGGILSLEAEEIEKRFQVRLQAMTSSYNTSNQSKKSAEGILTIPVNNPKKFQTSWFKQCYLCTIRAFQNELRNPLDVKLKFIQNIVFAIVIMILWNNVSNGLNGIQDRNGVLFMLATTSSFGSIQGSLGTFSLERPVFIRERLSKAYRTSAYFWGRSFSEVPFLFIYPLLLISMVYWVIGLNTFDASKYLICVACHILCWWAGSGFGLMLSTVIPKIEVAMALTPVLIVPLLAFAGFFVNQDKVPYFFYQFEYISPFKYTYQATSINEFTDLETLTCHPNPRCDALKIADFDESLAVCVICLGAIGIGMRLLSYIGLVKISSPKPAKLLPVLEAK